jgi:hypothetical protein
VRLPAATLVAFTAKYATVSVVNLIVSVRTAVCVAVLSATSVAFTAKYATVSVVQIVAS